jgi:LysM repeat protein
MRLILRNSLWILGFGLVLSAIVFLITRNQPGLYSSSTVLFTGIVSGNQPATGSNQYLASNDEKAKFANLIHLIKSRDVREETGLWLIAQHLMLSEPDPQICLPQTWLMLMKQAPDDVKNLVAKPLPIRIDTAFSQPVKEVEKVEAVPLIYIVKAGDFPSAIAEKYGITLEQLEQLNPGRLDPIVGGQRLRVGFRQKISVVVNQDTLPVQPAADSTPPLPEVEPLSRIERTVNNLRDYMEQDRTNFVYRLLQSDHPFYGIEKINSLSVRRIRNSDLIRLNYRSEDPAVSMNTLVLTTQVFMKHYKRIASPPISIFSQPEPHPQDSHEIRIVEEPVMPSESDASQKVVYLILAFLVGAMAVSLVIMIIGWHDHSIKYPDRFSKLLGVSLAGGYPYIPAEAGRGIDWKQLSDRAIDQITQKIRLEELRQNRQSESPFLVFMVSTRDKTGKTTVGARIVDKLRKCGLNVLAIKPIETYASLVMSPDEKAMPQSWDFEYVLPRNFLNVKSINELMRNYTFLTKGYQCIVIELPSLLTQEFPAVLAQSGNLSIVVGHASGTWKKADSEMLSLYSSTVDHPVMALLNGCKAENLKSLIGELPGRQRGIFGK